MVTVYVNDDAIEDIELFVFDKDGTVIDLYNYWSNMIGLRAQRLCSFYGLSLDEHEDSLMYEMGIDLKNKCIRPEGPVGLLPREVVQKAAEDYLNKLQCENVYDVCFKIFQEVDEASLSLLDKFITPLDGAIELLTQIKKNNCKIAIATTDKTQRAQLAMDFLNINGLFDFVVGADKVDKSKPSPDMLQLIVNALNISPKKAVMIGDAKTDVLTGINAGFKASIGVCTGLTSQDELLKITPYVVQSVANIKID
ncbi:MAG TPA: HAD family hydrolase [Phycisphaerales bacterium]|nr:HAD family hydrolase [Phycisphaerales bacterium]